jgi:hypothetical protein
MSCRRRCYLRAPPLLHTVTTAATLGHRRCYIWQHPLLHTGTAAAT